MFVCKWCVLPHFGSCDEVDGIVDIYVNFIIVLSYYFINYFNNLMGGNTDQVVSEDKVFSWRVESYPFV